MASTPDAALKLEIARLTGAINRHKSEPQQPKPQPTNRRWNNYVNPSYKLPSNKYARPGSSTTESTASSQSSAPVGPAPAPGSSESRDIIIGGVAFEKSRRSLVRKDLPKSASARPPRPATARPPPDYVRTQTGHLIKSNRVYKPKPPSRHAINRNRNMTLTNGRRPYQFVRLPKHPSSDSNNIPRSRRVSSKKYVDKPCPRFTMTGACNRGLTCPYQHDPSKIAICWPFLQGTCPHSADTCPLSHDPTPNRTPLCVHFANNGRCTREHCPFPHVRVGPRTGVCRDFAVLGYCEKGLDCDHQHVRECPDFAEHGACQTKRCKLPHVIRANRSRQAQAASAATAYVDKVGANAAKVPAANAAGIAESAPRSDVPSVITEDAQLGDEFISLTFNESESDEEDSDEENSEEDAEAHDENEEEGSDPSHGKDEEE